MIAAAALCTLVAAAMPAAMAAPPDAMPCQTPESDIVVNHGLPRLAARIKAREPATIVVLGTASSMDYGPEPAAKAYPERLLTEIRKLKPVPAIKIVNLSQRGETAASVVKRLDRELAAAAPDLIIWQTGSTDAVRQVGASEFADTLDEGIAQAYAHDVDVILMTPQYAPRAATVTNFEPYVSYMRQVAESRQAILFDRFTMMQHWREDGSVNFNPEGKAAKLLMVDKVHSCFAALLARMVVTATGDRAPEGRERPAKHK